MLPVAVLLFALFAIPSLGQPVTANSNPRFSSGTDVTVVENSGTYSAQWATQVSDGEGPGFTDSGRQTLSFTVAAATPSLFSTQPQMNSFGFLTFVPATDAYGTTQVSVTLRDSGTSVCVVGGNNAACPGGCSPSDCSASPTVTFQIVILPVNHCPTFSIRGDQTVSENSGQSSVTGFAYQVSAGASNENSQTVSFTVNTNNAALFLQTPQILWTSSNPTSATLQFTPATNSYGTATVTVVARDSGGTANSGCDTSSSQTFNVIVTHVNQRPSFTAGATPIIVNEDAGSITRAGWATVISPGANEASQAVHFNLQLLDPTASSLFSVQPTIDASTGTLSFTAAADANTFSKTVQMYVQLQDDGGSSPNDVSCNPITACPVLTIQITPVNDPASFIPGGNILVWEDLGDESGPPVPATYSNGANWASQITVGAVNEGVGSGKEGQVPVFVVTNTNNGLFDVQPAIDAQGTLTFQLKANANGQASVTATIKDTGSPSVNGNTATFTITVQPVNDAPTYRISYPNPVVIQQNAPTVEVPVWATSVVSGPPDENTQTLQFYAVPQDPTFFSVQPTVSFTDSGTGRLQFRVAPNRWGTQVVRITMKDDGGVQFNGVDQSAQTLTITVNFVNQIPTFALSETTITLAESASPSIYSRGGFAFNISAGANEDAASTSTNLAQTVRFSLSTNNEFLFSALPAIDSAGRLTFTPASQQFGEALVTVIAKDDNVPPASSIAATFTVRIQPVNQPPSISVGADITGRQVSMCLTSGACSRTFPRFATRISAGPANEASQQVTLTTLIQPQFNSLFAVPPAISATTGDLTFTLALNQYTESSNPVVVTVVVKDDGGTANGGTDTFSTSFKLSVLKIDLPPQFTPGPDVTVLEDSGRTARLSWATGVARSVTDQSTSGLSFIVQVQDSTLFAVQPQLTLDTGGTATLTFTPANDRFGSSQLQITLNDPASGQNSDQHTVTISITPVNDPPNFAPGADITVYQGSGIYTQAWASSISPGPFEVQQITSWQVTCDLQSLFAFQPTLNSAGTITFTLASAASGTTTCQVGLKDNGGTSNGGSDTKTVSLRIYVIAVNTAPRFVAGPDITILENIGAYVAPNWATQIADGDGNANQQLRFEVVPSDATVFAVPPRISASTGTLTFTLVSGANGNINLAVTLYNSGSSNGLNVNHSPTSTVLLVVTPVNQAPSFVVGANVAVLENSGMFLSKKWATQIAAGPSNELWQTLRFAVTPTPATLFSLPPRIDPGTGDLQFSPAGNKNGLASVTACLQDNGGTSNNGKDSSCLTFTIAVVAVNQAPQAIHPATVTILEDFGVFSMRNFLTSVTPGAGSDEADQVISKIAAQVAIADLAVFTSAPSISTDGSYTLSFTVASGWFGQVTVTLLVSDNGGVENGGIDTLRSTFTIVVLPVNHAPSFIAGSDVVVLQNSGQFLQLWASNLSPGPANEVSQSVTFSVTNNRPDMFLVAPIIDGQGFLSFTPAKNANGVATLSVVLTDNGGTSNGGVDRSLPVTLKVTIQAVNQPPSFDCDLVVTVLENSGPFAASGWARNIRAGPSTNEILTQTNMTFEVAADSQYFAILPTVSYPGGDLAFATAPNRWGALQLIVKLNDNAAGVIGGPQTFSRTITLNIQNVNQPPTFAAIGDIVVLEDAGDQVVANYITDLSGGPFEPDQSVRIEIHASNATLFSSPPRIIGGKDLLFTTAPDVNGQTVLTINATDSGSPPRWTSRQFVLAVTPVNDPPVFQLGDPITVMEDAGTVTAASWLRKAVPGPVDELYQSLTPHWDVQPPNALSGVPSLDMSTKSLLFTPAPDRFGTVTLALYFSDNGGTANGGRDTAPAQSFELVVQPVNDPPTFVPGPPVVLATGATGSYSARWATNVSAGPFETSQSVAFDVSAANSLLFSADGYPSITPDGVLSFTVRPGAIGNTTLTVTLRDSENGVSAPTYISVVVNAYRGPDIIVLTVGTDYDSFNQAQFKTTVSQALSVDKSRLHVLSVSRGSTIVRFYFTDDSALTSDQLTRAFVSQVTGSQPFRTQLNAMTVEVVPQATFGTGSPGVRGSETSSSPFNYPALVIGLVAAVSVIVLAVVLAASYRRRQLKKHPSAMSLRKSIPNSGSNPIPKEFDESGRKTACPYDDSPQLDARSSRWPAASTASN